MRPGSPKSSSARARASSVLPTPVGPTKRKHAEGLVRIGQPGLDQGDQIDDGVDRLGLAHDAGLEEGADLGAVERDGVVEEVDRDAGGGRDGAQDVAVR